MYYDRTDASEEIDINKKVVTLAVLAKGFNFQLHVCSGCHDLLMMSTKLRHIAILNIKGGVYCCIIRGISKSEAKKHNAKYCLYQTKQNIIKDQDLLSNIKIGKEILTSGDIKTEKKKLYHHKSPIF